MMQLVMRVALQWLLLLLSLTHGATISPAGLPSVTDILANASDTATGGACVRSQPP